MFKTTLKQSASLSLPLVISDLIYALNVFITIAITAQLGKEQLAASGLVWQFYVPITFLIMGPFSIIAVTTSQYLGAKNSSGIVTSFQQGIIMALIASLPMMLILRIAPTLLVITKQKSQIVNCTLPFFHTLMWTILPNNLSKVLQQFLCGLGKTKLIMFIAILSLIIELPCYYLLLFGKFGLPQLGLKGISYGLFFSHCITTLICFLYLRFSLQTKNYCLLHNWTLFDGKYIREILRTGLPLGFMWCTRSSFFTVLALMMGTISTAALAAHQIARQYFRLPITIVYSLAQSAAIKIAKDRGANDNKQARSTITVHIIISFLITFGFVMFYTFAPEAAISFDTNSNPSNYSDVIPLALQFFPFVVVCLLIDCIRVIFNGALRGLKDGLFQLLIYLGGSWLLTLPIAYILGFIYKFGGVGIWWSLVIGAGVMGMIFATRFLKLTSPKL